MTREEAQTELIAALNKEANDFKQWQASKEQADKLRAFYQKTYLAEQKDDHKC